MFDTWTDEQFAAWLAGFFDGEGSVDLAREGITLSIANTVRAVMEAVHARTGVGNMDQVEFINKPWRTKYVWRIRNFPEIRTVLLLIRPYLTIKALVADAALERIAAKQAFHDAVTARNHEMQRLRRDEGLSYSAIAKRYGVSWQFVQYADKKWQPYTMQTRRAGGKPPRLDGTHHMVDASRSITREAPITRSTALLAPALAVQGVA